jgi:HK97 family phage major capsid protein
MPKGNDELLEKAFATDDLHGGSKGGLLNPEQANAFIDMLIENSVIWTDARVERMAAPQKKIEKLGFASRIMMAAEEGTDPESTSKPTTGIVTLSTVEAIACVDVTYSALEDNIERERLLNNLMGKIAARAVLDLEELGIKGDTGNMGDDYLALLDGWFTQSTTHVVNCSAADTCIEVLSALYKEMPKKYVRIKSQLRYYVTEDFEQSFREELAGRETGAGDRYLLEDAPVKYAGIPVVSVPTMTAHSAMLVHPDNLIVGIQRDINVETERKPRKRVIEVTLTCRVDAKFEEEDAVVTTITIPSDLG